MTQKKILLFLVLCHLAIFSYGQKITEAWTIRLPDSTQIISKAIGADSSVVLLMRNETNVVYNTSDSSGLSKFKKSYGVIKYDIDGTFIWSKFYEDSLSNIHFVDVGIDSKDRTFLLGHFSDSIDFDPGVDTVSLLNSSDNEDIFLIQLSEDGDYQNHIILGGEGNEKAEHLLIDFSDKVLIAGMFDIGTQSGLDFNPSNTETDSLTASNSNGDNFLLQLENDLSYDWVFQFNRSSGDSLFTINDLKRNSGNEILVCGVTDESFVDFGNNSDTVGFLLKLDHLGSVDWAIKPVLYPDSVKVKLQVSTSIAIDNENQIYLAGYYELDSIFNDSLITNHTTNISVNKINGGSGENEWLHRYEEEISNKAIYISFDEQNDILVFGTKYDTIPNNKDSFVFSLYNETGEYLSLQDFRYYSFKTINRNTSSGNYFINSSNFASDQTLFSKFYPHNRTTWENNKWSHGVPSLESHAIIKDFYSTSSFGGIDAFKLEVTSKGRLDIKGGVVFVFDTLQNDGNITMSSLRSYNGYGALIHTEYKGKGIFSASFNTLSKNGYSFFSSPVEGASSSILGTAFYYNERAGQDNKGANWQVPRGDLFAGQGYAVYQTQQSIVLVGKPNYGGFNVPVTNTNSDGFNLIGNPYTAPINGNDVIASNDNVSALYFWKDDDSNGVDYKADDYITYNFTGSTGGGGMTYYGRIPMGQGFFVNVEESGNVHFKSSMRIEINDSYLRKREVNNRLWISLEGAKINKELLIASMDWASDDFDKGWDAFEFKGTSSFSSIDKNNNHLAIQALPIQEAYDISLNLEDFVGEGIIKIRDVEGFNEYDIILEDHKKGTSWLLNQGGYEFESSLEDTERFSLSIVPSNGKILDLEKSLEDYLKVATLQEGFKIISPMDATLTVFNLSGKVITETTISEGEFFVSVTETGVFLFHFNTAEGSFTRKLLR